LKDLKAARGGSKASKPRVRFRCGVAIAKLHFFFTAKSWPMSFQRAIRMLDQCERPGTVATEAASSQTSPSGPFRQSMVPSPARGSKASHFSGGERYKDYTQQDIHESINKPDINVPLLMKASINKAHNNIFFSLYGPY
jgi:hypothetical protein